MEGIGRAAVETPWDGGISHSSGNFTARARLAEQAAAQVVTYFGLVALRLLGVQAAILASVRCLPVGWPCSGPSPVAW
jgi:hypothetical protein